MRSKRTIKQRKVDKPTGQTQVWYQVKIQRNKSTLYFVPSNSSSTQVHTLNDIQQQESKSNCTSNIISQTNTEQNDWVDIDDRVKTKQNVNLNHQANQQNHTPTTYRPDIDGIRAIAILLVVIYHAFPSKLPGGFIGVDVFFVISGYLITQIIVKQILQQKFSLLNFYSRRIKRIYPVLIIVLSFALWIIHKFPQIDLVNFSLDTLNYSLVFCANLNILSHKKDYFDADIRGNPLLHLWSLGVQEQFYIVWPFLVLLVFKYCRKSAMKTLIIFTVGSFILSIICVNINAKFAFYFPFCRFWQMSVGGIFGYAHFSFKSKIINNLLSLVGLMSILVTSFVLTDQSLFPGFWALIPTLSCAFIIQAKSDSVINKYILSSKIFTFIGKISYSLYLWHWPLLVYSRILYPHGSTSIFSNIYFIVGLAFGSSILNYFIVENPLRKMKNVKIVIFLLLLMGFLGIASIHIRRKASQNYFSKSDITTIEFFNKVNRQMIPQAEDYVTINGKKHPNFSYNNKRLLPTDIKQVHAQMMQQRYQEAHGGEYLLQKHVDKTSHYADMLDLFRTQKIKQFAVANEGQENQLFLIGDSHIEKISYHFQELFRKSQIKGTLDSFPTILTALRRGVIMGKQNLLLNFIRALVQKHEPQRILFAWN